jgi:hypothetical protein
MEVIRQHIVIKALIVCNVLQDMFLITQFVSLQLHPHHPHQLLQIKLVGMEISRLLNNVMMGILSIQMVVPYYAL